MHSLFGSMTGLPAGIKTPRGFLQHPRQVFPGILPSQGSNGMRSLWHTARGAKPRNGKLFDMSSLITWTLLTGEVVLITPPKSGQIFVNRGVNIMTDKKRILVTLCGFVMCVMVPRVQAQTTRDSALAIAALGADIRSRFNEAPLVVLLAVDNSGERGFAGPNDYTLPKIGSEAAWQIRLLASTAQAAIVEPGTYKEGVDGLPSPGPAKPTTRILTLGRISCGGNVCKVLLRIETPPSKRGISENTLWLFTVSQAPSLQSVVTERRLVFSAELRS